ncbi:protein CUSTOS-like [Ptychodera flava]|uniref:protein CUSTOS-like n=1 Tax=Ptychodera flava TaxID=63121 RepID=UPI00396A34E0
MAARISSELESSSDEDEKLRLQDAVVNQSELQHNFEVKNKKKTFHSNKPSLRRKDEDENDKCDYKSIQATKEFRQHVAKRLETMLDSAIDVEPTDFKKFRRSDEDSSVEHEGFKLFSTSDPTRALILDDAEEVKAEQNKSKKHEEETSSSDSDSVDERLLQAAVTQDDVVRMGRMESRFDENKKTKGQCETIENGTLTSLNSSGLSENQKKKKKKKRKSETAEMVKSENGVHVD